MIFHKTNLGFRIFLLGVFLIFSVSGFAQLTPTYIGSATSTGGNCYTITTNTGNNSGAAWYNNPIDLSQDFDIVFDAFFGANPNGADGIAFVLKSTPTAVIGNLGEGLGYQNITGNSMAIEFDTFTNTNQGDPSYDHIGVESAGQVNHNLVPPVQASSTSTNIKDNQQHEVKITWRANTHILKVYFDCVERVSYDNQIIISIFGGQPTVYFGFTGSTGGSSNQQSVCFKYLSFLPSSLQDQTVCEGESISNIDGTIQGATGYLWTPATGVSNPLIPNPVFTPTATTTYTLTVTDGCGQSFVRGEFTATIPDVEVADPEDLHECGDPTQTAVFNLQLNDPIMKEPLADPSEYDIEYYQSMAEIDNGDPMIPSSNNYTGYNGQIIYAKAVGFSNPCYVVRTFQLVIDDCSVELQPYAVHACEPAPYDGEVIFDLTSYTDEMTVANPVPASYVYSFYNTQANANAATNPITNPTTYSGSTETVWVRCDDPSVVIGPPAFDVEALSLVVDPQPVVGTYADAFGCDSYTLTPATVGNYYTGPGGTGTQLNPAVPLTTSQTVYVYAVSGTAPDTCT
ncbi:MAG: hypothetical protein DI539_12445, partial [Flavobacterium psychrophilum]